MINWPIPEGLTFDDVLIIPARSDVQPVDTDVSTRLSRRISLNVPIVSAAMDTVTESKMAIGLAQQGGIGIIHRNLPLERQAEEVDKVKRHESGMIVDPITIRPGDKIAKAQELMRHYRISGLPITDDKNRLLGIVTNRDLRFETRLDLPVEQVMTKDLVTVPVGTTLEKAEDVFHKHKIEKLLMVDAQGRLKGLITYKDILKRIQYPHAAKDSYGRLRVGAAVGVGDDILDRAAALIKASVDVLVLDTAHGHSQRVMDRAKLLKSKFPEQELIVGNIGTAEAARDLIELGVDGLKVGVGPGSICTTRIVSGAGIPQITAVDSVCQAARDKGIPVISDGGIKYSGDIAKAIVAGADTVMLGSLLAGAEESPGEVEIFQGRSYKTYRGMGSLEAMREGSRDRYFQDSPLSASKLVPEGIVGRVPFKGGVAQIIQIMVGGLKSGMGYAGCRTIAELQAKARFMRISQAGLRESHVHDVTIIREAPNYSLD